MKKVLLALIASALFVPAAFADDQVASVGQGLQQGQGQVLEQKEANGTLGNGMKRAEQACQNSSDPQCKEKLRAHRQAVREQDKEKASQQNVAQ